MGNGDTFIIGWLKLYTDQFKFLLINRAYLLAGFKAVWLFD